MIRQNIQVTCPTKPTAIYSPTSIWLADWRLPQTSSLLASSTSTSAFSFFTRAKVALEDVKTPMLRSLNGKTRSFVWGYLNSDEGTAKEGRVELVEVPDGSRSLEGFKRDETAIDLNGMGSAESIRFLHDPADPSAGSPNLKPNLTPPMSGSWVTGTLDPSIKKGQAYFTVCEPTTANAGIYHLFRAGVPALTRKDNLFSLFYSSCQEVYIHVERVADENICFRWDMAKERDVSSLTDLGEKRLFTLYHNSITPSVPVVITPEVDIAPPKGPITSPSNIGDESSNPNPKMKNYDVPITRKTSQASNAERTISSITAVEDLLTDEDNNDTTSFAEGLKDFMGTGRGTPAFGSTENSDGDSSREGLDSPDEINIVSVGGSGGGMVTPGTLVNRVSLPREDRKIDRNRLAVPISNANGSPARKGSSIWVQDYNSRFPMIPIFDPRPQEIDNSQGSLGADQRSSNSFRPRPQALITSNPLLGTSRSRGSLPFITEPRAPSLMPSKDLERHRESILLPGIVNGRSGSIPSTNTNVNLPGVADLTRTRPMRGYQNIPGVDVGNLLPTIKQNPVQNPTLPPPRGNDGMKLLQLKEIEDEDVVVVETPGFPNAKPAIRSSPMDMYITSDGSGLPVVMNRSGRPSVEKGLGGGLSAGDWKKPVSTATSGYVDISVPEGLKGRARNWGTAMRKGLESYVPSSPRGSIPGSPKGLQGPFRSSNPGTPKNSNVNPRPERDAFGGIKSANRSPRARSPSPQSPVRGIPAGSPSANTPRARTPSPTSSGLRNGMTGGGSTLSPNRAPTTSKTTGKNSTGGEKKIREKVEVIDYKKIIEDRKKKSTIPNFKNSRDFFNWLKENRSGDQNSSEKRAKLVGAKSVVANPANSVAANSN
ncbi:hypothetical protein TWF730_009000 [Orbilia blumenaviensis]|uniref:Uncharacterized protein n=1 Tax=Orbilia blumenaviensis TaxID=1796055 RepID=A0AAV9V126_9PEZI